MTDEQVSEHRLYAVEKLAEHLQHRVHELEQTVADQQRRCIVAVLVGVTALAGGIMIGSAIMRWLA